MNNLEKKKNDRDRPSHMGSRHVYDTFFAEPGRIIVLLLIYAVWLTFDHWPILLLAVVYVLADNRWGVTPYSPMSEWTPEKREAWYRIELHTRF